MSKETTNRYVCKCKRMITIKAVYDEKDDIVRITVSP